MLVRPEFVDISVLNSKYFKNNFMKNSFEIWCFFKYKIYFNNIIKILLINMASYRYLFKLIIVGDSSKLAIYVIQVWESLAF